MRTLRRSLTFILVFILLVSACPAAFAVRGENVDTKLVALTFDDGPHRYTGRLLDGLKERGAKATFFTVGYNAEAYPELLKRIADEGHQLGNHSDSHGYLFRWSEDEVRADLSVVERYLTEADGNDTHYLRPPYGSVTDEIRAAAVGPIINWSVDPEDWKYLDTETVVNNILSVVKDGDIVLLHDIYETSVEAAFIVIDTLQARGYEFVTVSELLRRRGITPVDGQVYSYARNNGVNLGPVDVGRYFDETKLSEHWAYSELNAVFGDGLIDMLDDGMYYPDMYITKGRLLTALLRFDGAVSDEEPASVAEWAAACGIVSEELTDEWYDEFVSRADMLSVMCGYMAYAQIEPEHDASELSKFSDVEGLDETQLEVLACCSAAGLIRDSANGDFRPDENATRAETAVMISALSEYVQKVEQERLEAERLAAEAAAKAEQERLAAEAAAKAEQERLEAERLAAEAERLAAEAAAKAEQERQTAANIRDMVFALVVFIPALILIIIGDRSKTGAHVRRKTEEKR